MEPIVFLATPLVKSSILHVETAKFCSIISRSPQVIWGHIGMHGTELSRNLLIENYMNSGRDWTHIFFLDSDIAPPSFAFKKMLELDVDFVTGLYPVLMKEGLYWAVAGEDGNLIPFNEKLPEEPFETSACAAGCMLIRREVIEKMEWPYFKVIYQSKKDGNPMKKGEDIYFSEKVRDMGYKIIADPSIQCRHYNPPTELMKIYKLIENQVKTGKVRAEKA